MIFWFKSNAGNTNQVQEVESELKKSGSSVSFGTKGCGTSCGLQRKKKKLFSLFSLNLKTQFVLSSYSKG